MKNTVLFRCLAADQIEWHDGEWHLGSVVEFAAATRNKRRTLVVPTERILLTATSVPGRNRALRIKALPYTLEDSLADPVEDLHFAIGALTATDVAVAVVRHAVMEAWLATLDALGMTIDAMIPDALLLPLADNAWSVLLEERRAVVRLTPWRGFACERALLPLFLQRALEHHQAPVLGGCGPPDRRRNSSDPRLDIRVRKAPAPAFAVFAQSRPAPSTSCSGAMRRAVALRHTLVPGARRPRWAVRGSRCKPATASSNTAGSPVNKPPCNPKSNKSCARQSPPTRKIVNARAQLDSRLQELRRAPAGRRARTTYRTRRRGARRTARPGLRIRALRYQDDRLDFDLEGGSPEAIDQLRQKLQTLPGTASSCAPANATARSRASLA
ncbi:MAG: type II secretion system protein GspL [Gammaproteobacteria bacterium]